MFTKEEKNKILDKIFELLKDCKKHKISAKDFIDNYDFIKHPPVFRKIINSLIDGRYIKSYTPSNTYLEIDTLGLDVLEFGSWTAYENRFESKDTKLSQPQITYTNIEKVGAIYRGDITSKNVKVVMKESTNKIYGDNLGVQSSEIEFKNIKIAPKIKPKEKKTKHHPIFTFVCKFWWLFIIPLIVGIILILINNGKIDIGLNIK